MNLASPETKKQLQESLRHEIFELEEREKREQEYHELLLYKLSVIDYLLQECPDLQELDMWELEREITEVQIEQSERELEGLELDLFKERRLLEIVIQDGG
jgi:hypothetical protein